MRATREKKKKEKEKKESKKKRTLSEQVSLLNRKCGVTNLHHFSSLVGNRYFQLDPTLPGLVNDVRYDGAAS